MIKRLLTKKELCAIPDRLKGAHSVMIWDVNTGVISQVPITFNKSTYELTSLCLNQLTKNYRKELMN